MTTLTSLLPFFSSLARTDAPGGGSVWGRLVGAVRRVLGRFGRQPAGEPVSEPTERAVTPPAAIRPADAEPDAAADAAPTTAPTTAIEPTPRTTTRFLWGIEVAVADPAADDMAAALSEAPASATPATPRATPATPAIPADDYGLAKARSMAEIAAEACREAAENRTGFISTPNPPVPVRRNLHKRQLNLAAVLYENAAEAMKVVEIALDRDYSGDRRWAVSVAAQASSQLLDFLRTIARQDSCPVQKAVYTALDAVTKDRQIYVAEGMSWKQTIPYGTFTATSRHLELAAEGRTKHDAARDRLLRTLMYDVRQIDEGAAVDMPRMLTKIDTTVASLLAKPHQLRHRDPLLAAVAGLADEVDFDPSLHPAIAAVADAEGLTETERAADTAARDTRTVGQVIDACIDRWDGKLVFALNSRSSRDYPYARPREAEPAFDWLATTYRDAMMDSRSVPHEELNASLLETACWHYRHCQSATTVGRYREWYECTWDGRRYEVLAHVGRGNTRRMANNAIRIGFAWDRDRGVVVIGFIGQHQRTTQS